MPYFTPINGVIKKVYSSRIYDNVSWNFTGLTGFNTIDTDIFKSELFAQNNSLYSIATSDFELKEGDNIELYVDASMTINSESPASSVDVIVCVGDSAFGDYCFESEKQLISNSSSLGSAVISSVKTVNKVITSSDLNVNDKTIKLNIYIENPADSGKSISRVNSITLKVNGNIILSF